MKKTALLSSIVTIALCLCLIAGSTFALFTSESTVDVAVDAGRVSINAGLTAPTLWSAIADPEGEEFDEYGKTYTYEKMGANFKNGGYAGVTGVTGDNVINMVNVTPGDKITFQLTGNNTSDVAVKYRFKIECIGGYDLMSGFTVTIEDEKYPSMASFVSEWRTLSEIGEEIKPVDIAIELPVSAGNYYQEKSADIKITVEAIQSNADTTDAMNHVVKYITKVQSAAELKAKLASDEYLHIFLDRDINELVVVDFDLEDKTIDANKNKLPLAFAENVALENVVLKNIARTERITVKGKVSGSLTIADSTFSPASGIAVEGGVNPYLDLTIDNCTFNAKGSAVSFTNLRNLTIRKSTIDGVAKGWAVSVSESVGANVVFSDNTIKNCAAGILNIPFVEGSEIVTAGSLSGNVTIANNKFLACGKNVDAYMFVKSIKNILTFSNNTMDDVVVTAGDMVGLVVPTVKP